MITSYFNVKEAAEILRVTEITMRRWCTTGLIKSKKIGKKWLIPEEELILFQDESIDNKD
jgi:excisionase family DNA binding protein